MNKLKIVLTIIVIIFFTILLLLFSLLSSSQNEEKKTNEITLLFTGDLMHHEITYNMPNYDKIYKNTQSQIKKSDLAFINIEFPINSLFPKSGYPFFNATSQYLDACIKAGFCVFSLANNHINDFGKEGIIGILDSIQESIGNTNERPIFLSGVRKDKNENFNLEIIKIKNLNIGFLSVTGFVNTERDKEYVDIVSYHNKTFNKIDNRESMKFLERVRKMRSLCDFLIISFHDGLEYQEEPEEIRKKIFRELVLNGADIIWGHHSHSVQNTEIVDRGHLKKTDGLIVYSTGNLISGQLDFDTMPDLKNQFSATGDGVFWEVKIKKKSNTTFIKVIKPYWINNYLNQKDGLVVSYTNLLSKNKNLPERWKKYFTYRLKQQKRNEKIRKWKPENNIK